MAAPPDSPFSSSPPTPLRPIRNRMHSYRPITGIEILVYSSLGVAIALIASMAIRVAAGGG